MRSPRFESAVIHKMTNNKRISLLSLDTYVHGKFVEFICHNISCTQAKRSLDSIWNVIRTFAELSGHGDERWPNGSDINIYPRGVHSLTIGSDGGREHPEAGDQAAAGYAQQQGRPRAQPGAAQTPARDGQFPSCSSLCWSKLGVSGPVLWSPMRLNSRVLWLFCARNPRGFRSPRTARGRCRVLPSSCP